MNSLYVPHDLNRPYKGMSCSAMKLNIVYLYKVSDKP